jgi:bacteriorhodopsin
MSSISNVLKPNLSTDGAPTSTKGILQNASIAIGAAAVVNTVLGNVANAAGVDMAAKGFGSTVRESIPVFAYFVSTVIGGILGTVLLLIMKRLGTKQKVFLAVTIVLTILSLVSPLASDMSNGTKVVLELMHVIAAIMIIPALARSLKK